MNTSGKKRMIMMMLTVLLFTFSIHFSNGQARYVGRDFIEYCGKVPWEDVFLHTDREQYISGENMWFNVYAYDRQHLKPSMLSKIAYVELLNYNNKPVVRRRIYLSDGSGPGQISLPDTLSSGIYILKAYTAWMKNFMPEGCFTREIGIYNPVSMNSSMRIPAREKTESTEVQNGKGPGFQLLTENTNPDIVELTLIASEEFRQRNGSLCNLFIHTRGNINLSESVALAGDITKKAISRKMLLPGINQITIFDVHGLFVTERFIYTPPAVVHSNEITSDSVFGKRDRISIEIDPAGTADLRNMSISVAPVNAADSPGLEDFLVFGTEFSNDLLKKFQKLKNGIHPALSIDSMLENVHSNWIDWNVITGQDSMLLKYQPETSEHFLSGKLLKNEQSEDYVIMSIPGKEATFRYARADKDGNFEFSIPVDEQLKEIIIQPDDKKAVVNIGSSFSEEYPVSAYTTETVPDFVTGLSVNFQVQKIYETIASADLPPRIGYESSRRFYGKPDVGLVLDDYIKLPVMEEIFFELLPGTYLKKRKSEYEIWVTDPVTSLPFDFPTTLFVDGVRIDDAGAIAAIDPEFVEKIDVVRERYMVGDYLFHGIVNIITKTGDFTLVPIPEYAVRTFYRVIDPIERFIAPDYNNSGNPDHTPDFRNTLWWDSEVDPGKPVNFWSSDVQGKYRIEINATTFEGSPFSAEKIITIK